MRDCLQSDGVLYEVVTGADRRFVGAALQRGGGVGVSLLRHGADRIREIVASVEPGQVAFAMSDLELAAAFDRMVSLGEVELAPLSPRPVGSVFKHGDSEAPATSELTDLAAQHFVEFRFVDTEGQPVAGLDYVFHTPDGAEDPGTLGQDGRIRKDFIEDGTYGVELKSVVWARWASADTACDDAVELTAKVTGCDDGTKVTVRIFREFAETDDDVIETFEGEVSGGAVAMPWCYDYASDEERGAEQGQVRFIAEVALDNGSWAKTEAPLVVTLKTIVRADWDLETAAVESPVELFAEVAGFSPDATATMTVMRMTPRGDSEAVATLEDIPVSGDRVSAAWTTPETAGELYFEVAIDEGVPRLATSDFLSVTKRRKR